MSSNAVDTADFSAPPEVSRLTSGEFGSGVRPLLATAGLAVAAGVALSIHHFLPDKQVAPVSWVDSLPNWQRPYSVVLSAFLTISLLWAVGQFASRFLRRGAISCAPLLAGAVGWLCVWELLTVKWAWLPHPYFPGPGEVLASLVEDRWFLFTSAWHSLRLLFAGYLVGAAVGLVLGVLIGWFPSFRYWAMPVLKIAGPIPATALVALAMMLFPRSLAFFSGSMLIAYAVLFPMTTLTSSGISNVKLSYLDVARTLGAGPFYLVFRIAIPAALPNIFLGLFVGLLASFLTLIAAESVGVRAGLGAYIDMQKGYAEYSKVYAALAITAVFCSALLTLLFRVRDRVLKWQKGVIKW